MLKNFCLAALLVLPMSSAFAQSAGTLVKASGQVFTRQPGQNEAAAVVGAQLPAGTQVRTGADGSAEVTFTDGSQLRLGGNSQVALSSAARQQKKSSVLLFFGKIWSKVVPSTTGNTSYEVGTANAVCGVRGTEFTTEVADDGSMRMQVSEGKVAVTGDAGGDEQVAAVGEQVEANETGAQPKGAASTSNENKWRADKRERLRTQGGGIVKAMKDRVMQKKQKLEELRARQAELLEQKKAAMARLKGGDRKAQGEVRDINAELQRLADQIADLGDVAQAQLGYVDHVAELAADPRFKMINRKMIEADAKALLKVRATLDKLVAEGTDISIESMDQMMDDMSKGKGSIKDKKGSAGDDLFGEDPMKMR